MMSTLTSRGTLSSPRKLLGAVDAATQNLTVDSTWADGEIRDFGLSLRNLRQDDIAFLTAPTAPEKNRTVKDVGAVVGADRREYAALGRALNNDAMAEYAATHTTDQLAGGRDVR